MKRPSLLVLALALCGAAAVQGATLSERAAAIDAPARGAEVKLAGPLQVGRGEIVPAPGTRVRALLAGGVPCGLVFEGPAELRYRVEDRFSIPVAERNVRRFSTLITRSEGTALEISEELSGAVVWGWGLGEEGQANGAALPDWAEKLLAGRRFTPPSHALLAAEANGIEGVRFALLRGELVELLLHVDPRQGEESLYRLAKGAEPGQNLREGIWRTSLAAQPIGRAWWDRPPADLVAEHERIAVENPRGEMLRIVSRSRLRARRAHPAGTALWQADLIDRIYADGGLRHEVAIRSVRVDGRDADFLHRNDELLVALGRALAGEETVEVEVAYEGEMAQHRFEDSAWVLGIGPWYPRDDLAGELATMEITVDVPAAWTPFASGAEVSRTQEGGRHKLATRLDRPMQTAVVMAGKYRVLEETQKGVTCRAAINPMQREEAARKLIGRFFAGRAFFEQLFDEPYPFRDFAILQIREWGFGQAPPGIVFFTGGFQTAPVHRWRPVFVQDLNARYLHEIAHGWWGHLVKMNAPEEAWLTEAFSDYAGALAEWYLQGKGRGDHELDEMVKHWVQAANELRPGASLYLAGRIAWHDERDKDDLLRLRLGKGPLVVHAIRLELQRQKGSVAEGDLAFTGLLRKLLKRNRYEHVTTPDLVKELDKLTGGDWQPWFEKYVYGTEIPQLPKVHG